MLINLEKVKQRFIKYTENYDMKDENIKRKQLHSFRVMKISEQIAKALNLKDDEIQVASLIGLLHDIARFEQYKQFNTYKDSQSFDHGDYGTEILKDNLRDYIETEKYDSIILKAVKNHNKYKIEEGLNEKELLFSKIIRDADKLDIFYETQEIYWIGQEKEIEKQTIDEIIKQQLKQLKQIERGRNYKKNDIGKIMTIIAFIFDINFKISFEIIQKQDYINKILNRFEYKDEETKKDIEEIRKIVNEYIKRKESE